MRTISRTSRAKDALSPTVKITFEDFSIGSLIRRIPVTMDAQIANVEMDDELGVIRNPHPLPGELSEYRSAPTHGTGEKYALITLLPGPQPGRHILILSGSGSELMWALAECVSNPEHVKEIVSHLQSPSGEFPRAFQVIIQATFEANVPVKIRYVTHRISKIS